MSYHHDMIGIELHHLRIVIDMRLHQGTKRTMTAVHPLAHRRSPTYTATFLLTHMGTIFIDILHLHQLGAMTRVHMHMSLHQGTLWSVIDILHRGIIIAIAHLMIITAMVHRMIVTAIDHLMIV